MNCGKISNIRQKVKGGFSQWRHLCATSSSQLLTSALTMWEVTVMAQENHSHHPLGGLRSSQLQRHRRLAACCPLTSAQDARYLHIMGRWSTPGTQGDPELQRTIKSRFCRRGDRPGLRGPILEIVKTKSPGVSGGCAGRFSKGTF